MTRTVYLFTFERGVAIDAVEDALVVAAVAGEAMHADERADVLHVLDRRNRTCALDARTESGATTLSVFFALVTALAGPEGFRVVTAEDLAERKRRTRRGKAGRRRTGARR